MSKYAVPDDREKDILQKNGIDPGSVAIEFADDDHIRALNYKTRDVIVIHRGDKKWS